VVKKTLALLFLASLGFGCPLREKDDRTPAGWKVKWHEQGTLSLGLHDKAQLYALFDAAMDRGIQEVQTGWGFDAGYVRHKLRENDALYHLVDNFYFPVIGGPPVDVPDAKYASGETLDRFEVYIAFYDKQGPDDPANVPAASPGWTLKDSTSYPGKVYWGMELDGQQYPATGYELHWQFTTAP
jgi:hypothetical protein